MVILRHIIFNVIILVLLVWGIVLSLPKFKGYYSEALYYKLKEDVNIINSLNNQLVGKIKKGAIIKSPSFYDFSDVEKGIKYKMIILPARSQLDKFEPIDCATETIVKYSLEGE